MTEQDQKIVDTAERLKVTVGTEGWQDILGYIEVRMQGLKNKLANMDLTNELTNACRTQGEIDAVKSIPNRVKQAEAIKKKEKK